MTTTDAMLLAGRLEQTCPACGRWEAAGATCSWCSRRMTATDWYENKDGTNERARRMPTTAPADPPTEYRRTYRPEYGDGWPPTWGTNPYKPARTRGTPLTAVPDQPAAPVATKAAAA